MTNKAASQPVSNASPSTTYKYMVLPGNESILMKEALERRPWWKLADEGSKWNFWWGGNGQRFDFQTFAGDLKSQQVVNRLENKKEICTKSGLAANLASILQQGDPGSCPWIPETYVLTSKSTAELASFKKAFERHAKGGSGTTWIVKPTSLNRGNGIEVFNSYAQLISHVNSKAGSSWVVQKYIDEPLLVHGRKFDLRAYVLVTPDRSVYLYREAYVRTCSTPYKLDDLSNRASHLTNDAVQKQLESYHQHEDHCKLTLEELQAAVGPAVDIQGAVWPQMQQCVRRLFGHVVSKLNPRRLQHCFELLGLDFMIDAKGQVVLIEVNTSPALFRAGKYLSDLLPRVIEEVVQRAVDTVLPPPPGVKLPDPLDGFEKMELVSFGGLGASGGKAGAEGRARQASGQILGKKSIGS